MGSIMGNTADNNLMKQPSEVRKFSMDFNKVLEVGETIDSIVSISSEKYNGTVTDLSISSSGLISTTGVSMFVSSGTDGNRYRIEVLVATNAGQTLEGDGILVVSDS